MLDFCLPCGAVAFATMAFAECPAPKECMDSEFLCSGPYDEKTGCYAMDTCMQMKDSNGCPGNFEFNSLIFSSIYSFRVIFYCFSNDWHLTVPH